MLIRGFSMTKNMAAHLVLRTCHRAALEPFERGLQWPGLRADTKARASRTDIGVLVRRA